MNVLAQIHAAGSEVRKQFLEREHLVFGIVGAVVDDDV